MQMMMLLSLSLSSWSLSLVESNWIVQGQEQFELVSLPSIRNDGWLDEMQIQQTVAEFWKLPVGTCPTLTQGPLCFARKWEMMIRSVGDGEIFFRLGVARHDLPSNRFHVSCHDDFENLIWRWRHPSINCQSIPFSISSAPRHNYLHRETSHDTTMA